MYIIFPVLTFPVPRFQSARRWRGVGQAAEQIEIAVVVTTIHNDDRGHGPADRQQAVEFIKPGRLSALIAPPPSHTHMASDLLRYDTIRDAILTCARKPTCVSLIYLMEPTTKKCKNRKSKSSQQICSEITVNSLGNPCSES